MAEAGAGAGAGPPALVRNGRQPPQNPVLRVVFRNADYVVVDKPADVRIDGEHEHTVEKLLKAALPEVDKPRLVHQLDYATSGVMCWALHRKAAAAACRAFQERTTSKYYLALVRGSLGEDVQVHSQSIANDPNHDFKMMVGDAANPGKTASTWSQAAWWGEYDGQPCSLVLLKPLTGRRHQLRVHMHHAGFPIVGDATYTDDTTSPRMMLHAWTLHLPVGGETLKFTTPNPFLSLLTNPRRNNACSALPEDISAALFGLDGRPPERRVVGDEGSAPQGHDHGPPPHMPKRQRRD